MPWRKRAGDKGKKRVVSLPSHHGHTWLDHLGLHEALVFSSVAMVATSGRCVRSSGWASATRCWHAGVGQVEPSAAARGCAPMVAPAPR